jgi:hypothetical protein
MRRCVVCEKELEERVRRDALYCGAACKQFAFRRRQKAARASTGPFDSPNPRLATIAVPVPAVVTIREARPVGSVPRPDSSESVQTHAPVVG